MTKKTLLWLVPVFLLIHNLEEALVMHAFIEKRNSAVPGPLRDIIPSVNYRQFLIALAIITIVPFLIALVWSGRETGVYLLILFQVVMLINVFAHVMMAMFLGGYAPGLVTAIFINLPFSLYLLKRAVAEGWVSKRSVALMFPLGIIIHGPLLFGLMMLAGRMARVV